MKIKKLNNPLWEGNLFRRCERGMTFIEIMIVVSLIGMVSLALFKSFANGMRIWQKSRELVVEEDIAILFDKLARDLRNTFVFSNLPFEGDGGRMSFPTIVLMPEMKSQQPDGEPIHQLGRVEYFYDPGDDSIKRGEANYSQALNGNFDPPRIVVRPVDRIGFRYYYLTDEGEIYSEQVLEVIPNGIEVTVTFSDAKGTRQLRRYINIPVKI